EGAFRGARLLHLATVVLLAITGLGLPVGALYWVGVGVVGALLLYEHSLVRPGDLRRLDAAFFTVNGVISVTFFLFVLVDSLCFVPAASRGASETNASSRGSTSTSRTTASSLSRARTARARRRCCGYAPGCSRRQEGSCASRRSAATSASSRT